LAKLLAFGLDPSSGSTGAHPLITAEKEKPDILISSYFFFLCLGSPAFLQGT